MVVLLTRRPRLDALTQAFAAALQLDTILATTLGTVVGLIIGSIPGLTFSMALALMLPFTFGMQPVPAIAMLLGVFVGGMTGGSVSAILLGIPGTPSAAATVFDGYPMALQGKAGSALGAAVIASAFGGLFSLLVMILLLEHVAAVAIKFGPAEIFALVLFGLSTICGLAQESMVRGLVAGVIGLMLMIVGLDELDGVARLTFDTVQLQQGVNLLVAMIGLFAVPQVISAFMDHDHAAPAKIPENVRAQLPSLRDLRDRLWLMVRCAGIGTGIGAIPGTGGPIAAFLAYDHARRFSRRPQDFGKGELSGVVAPESANNAVTGGTMIPLLSLGIPGDPATAVILGGLLIHGLHPGPMLFRTHLGTIYALYIAIFLAYVVILVVQLWGIRLFVRVLRVPPHLLAVCIIVLCVLGSYAIRNSIFDVYLMGVMGLLGYVLQRIRIPVAPVVLGLVLGETLEQQYRTALILSEGSHRIFIESGVALLFFGLTALTIGFHFWSTIWQRRPSSAT
ncbi:MAG: tripartite tricarboxylate transporter permease [Betaproteobacteria bacterium]|nr:tripartite tricarboxylate transporter permease [Betaproteobacteria bacterium]